MTISWRWTFSQIFRRFRHIENLRLFFVMLNTVLLIFRLWLSTLSSDIYTRKSSPTNIYLFKVNNRNTEKKCENYSKLTIKTPERLSTLLIVNFGHNSLLFLVSRCWLWTSKCLLGPTLSIYKHWSNTVASTDICTKILVK